MRRQTLAIALLALWTTLLAFLGFAPSSRLTFLHGLNDRWLHYGAFSVLAALLFMLFHQSRSTVLDVRALKASMGVASMLGLASECVQGLLPWRAFDVVDFLCDLAGIVTGLGVCILLVRRPIASNREQDDAETIVMLAM
jgi:VanZ family protein